jgi:hypothetical protein
MTGATCFAALISEFEKNAWLSRAASGRNAERIRPRVEASVNYWESGWVRIRDLTPEIEADMDRRAYNDVAMRGYASDYMSERDERIARVECNAYSAY